MHLRLYQASDLPSIVRIHETCGLTDPLIRYLYGELDKYPTSYHVGNYDFLRGAVITPGTVTYVIETDESDYVPGDKQRAPGVVAFAHWKRIGTSDTAKKWAELHSSWMHKLDRALLDVEGRYRRFFPSLSPSYMPARFAQVAPNLRRPWDADIFPEAWELGLLFVHPDWQRRGLGRQLMDWGFKTAQEEKVPVVVGSSPRGGAAYRAAGFRPFCNMGMAKFYDETEFGGETSQRWVWEPMLEDGDGIEGRWFERAKVRFEEEKGS